MTDPHEKAQHLLDYWRILVKRRWVVYTALLVMVATVALGSFLKRPVYTAMVRLQIEQSAPKVMPFQEVVSSIPDGRNDFYQTQYRLIQSRRIAGQVIADLELAAHDEFRVSAGWALHEGLTAEQAAGARRIDVFLKKLDVSPVRNSRLVDVLFSAHDPVLAARVANQVAETYIAFNNEIQYNTTTRATASLAHQVATLQEQIDGREKELQAYAREHDIIQLTETQNIVVKNLQDLSDAYTRARAERIEKEARYAALRGSTPADLPEVLQSDLIREIMAKSAELTRRYAQLSEKYRPEWPEMVRLGREIEANQERLEIERKSIYQQVLGAAEAAYRAARNQEERLASTLDEQKRRSQDLNLKEIHYNNLRAEVANKRSTLEALLRRQAETGSSAGLDEHSASNVRIVDRAEIPIHKSSPKILRNILLSVLMGLLLGVALGFFFEYLDKSVKSPDEIRQLAGLPSIGLIPALRAEGSRLRIIRPNGRETPPLVPVEVVSHLDPKSNVSEAFRETRTSLLVSQLAGPPRTILIASTQPGEGKTAVAVNLAITLAQIGRCVLLVDSDLRKPRLHRVFDLPNEEGLSSYLSGTGPPWPEPKRTPVPGLDVVTSGPLPPNPADLLDSDRFTRLQQEFEEQGYDHVIYDSPPVLAVADPAIMAARVQAVVMVIQAGATSRDALAHGLNRLQQVKARVVGAVLNRVDPGSQSYYYGYAHARSAGGEANPPAPPAARAGRGRDANAPI